MGKDIISGRTTRRGMLNGIQKLEEAIKVSYGPFGRTAIFQKGLNSKITKDGISIAEQIQFSDELENMGAQLVREAARKSNALSGDGSSLTTILTGEFCKEFGKLLDLEMDINQIRYGFHFMKDMVLNKLPEFKMEIKDKNDLISISLVSTNGDEEMTAHIIEAFTNIGDNGIVTIADSLSREGKTKVVFSSGLEFDKGFASGASVNTTHDSCELENPYIMITSKPFEEYKDIAVIFQVIEKENRPIVVFAPSFSEEIVAGFSELLRDKRIQGAMVLIPGLSKQDIYNNGKDLAVMTNSGYIFDDVDLDSFYPDNNCGTCGCIKITRNKTIISDPKYNEDEFDNYIAELKSKMDLDDPDEGLSNVERDILRERIAKMSGGIATIRIGSHNDMELGEKHDRYEDAVNAVRSAMSTGFVPGAGTLLLRISYDLMSSLKKCPPADLDTIQKVQAAKAFLNVLRRPAQMLIQSSGADPEQIVPEILSNELYNYGYNGRAGAIQDLIKAGIIDPFNVIYNALVYSSSVAEVFMGIDLSIVSNIKNMSIINQDPIVNPDGITF